MNFTRAVRVFSDLIAAAPAVTPASEAGPSKPNTKQTSASLPTAGFSTALKFAPRINKPKPAPARPAHASTAFDAAGVLEKAPTLVVQPKTSSPAQPEIKLGSDGKPLAAAPAMTIVDKKVKRTREQERERQKKKKARAGAGPYASTYI